jgi:hypothetical protein
MSSLSDRRKNNPRKLPIPWDEIEALYCAGHSGADIAEEYADTGLTAGNIRKRSSAECWPTPHNLRKKAEELIKKAEKAELGDRSNNPIDALVQRVASQQLDHQNQVLDITSQALTDLKDSGRKIIRSAHDFELIDRVARRTMDLDKEDETSNLAINIHGFAHPPEIKQADGHVVDGEA